MPVHIPIQDRSTTFALSEDGEWLCTHEDAYIDPACCSGIDSEGLPSCGCHGQDGVMCPAWDCTGIQDHEIDDLFDRLRPERDWEED